MGWSKKLKKAVSKVVKNAVQVSAGMMTGGTSETMGFGKGAGEAAGSLVDKVSGQAATDKKEAQAAEAAQQAAQEEAAAKKANMDYIANLDRQRTESILGRTKTDYTGDLTDEDEDTTTKKLLANRPLVAKRRALLG